jgi:hypothetical protein
VKAALVLMSRAPIPGKTKTRLHSHLKPEECAELHKAFLKDISNKLENIREQYQSLDLFLSYTPQGSENIFTDLISDKFSFMLQKGNDLGARMYNSISEAYNKSNEPVIITGSDLPSLPAEIITEAVAALKEKDIVIGPAADGGYYLIGMQTPYPFLFTYNEWGSDSVLVKTLKSASEHNLTIHFLPEWYDIDTFNELLIFRDELLNIKKDSFYPKHSRTFLDKILND